jgi:hypothetical protein
MRGCSRCLPGHCPGRCRSGGPTRGRAGALDGYLQPSRMKTPCFRAMRGLARYHMLSARSGRKIRSGALVSACGFSQRTRAAIARRWRPVRSFDVRCRDHVDITRASAIKHEQVRRLAPGVDAQGDIGSPAFLLSHGNKADGHPLVGREGVVSLVDRTRFCGKRGRQRAE